MNDRRPRVLVADVEIVAPPAYILCPNSAWQPFSHSLGQIVPTAW